MNIKRKSVAFNLDDPGQVSLWEHAAKRTNFSYYVKSLIQRDMEGGANTVVKKEIKEEVPTDFIDGFI